jgi:hypothetical protein
MFTKVFTITATGHQYEKASGSFYYTIQEDGRIIDEDNYLPYVDWVAVGNSPTAVSGERFLDIIDGLPVIDTDLRTTTLAAEAYTAEHPDLTMEERMTAIENSFLDDLMTRM